jgi:glycosyltransferase involved in cell wall biosynthesis
MVMIPARNEEAAIGAVVRSVKNTLPGIFVLVIDDHSSDATAQMASSAGARVVRLSRPLGLAGCLRTGYRIAVRKGFSTVVRIDGDGQHEAADIPELLGAMHASGAHIVIGSRFLTPRRWRTSLVRAVGIAALRYALAGKLGQTVHDPTSGFIGVRGKALKLLASACAAYPEAGALIALKREGCRIHEIPCRMYPRQAGRSSMTFVRSLFYMGRILSSLSGIGVPRGLQSRPE